MGTQNRTGPPCPPVISREVSRNPSLPVQQTVQPVGPTALRTLKVDYFFEGFTHEQINGIAGSAKHFSTGGKKRRRRMPSCKMGDEWFTICAVTSEELKHQAKRFDDGVWVDIKPPAIIKWQSWSTPPGTPPDADSRPAYYPPALIIQRMYSAAEQLNQAKARVELAMRELWGITQVEGFREEVSELYSRTHQVHKIIRRYIDDAAK